MKSPAAVLVARAHIEAWSSHDWVKTKSMLAPDIHAVVASTQPNRPTSEFTGIDNYMSRKMKSARLVEPGSVKEITALGDEHNALIVVTFRIGLGTGGKMVTMARSCLYLIDDDKKIKEERDSFYIIP